MRKWRVLPDEIRGTDAVQVTYVVFKTKIDLNAESTVGIMTMTGKGMHCG